MPGIFSRYSCNSDFRRLIIVRGELTTSEDEAMTNTANHSRLNIRIKATNIETVGKNYGIMTQIREKTDEK